MRRPGKRPPAREIIFETAAFVGTVAILLLLLWLIVLPDGAPLWGPGPLVEVQHLP